MPTLQESTLPTVTAAVRLPGNDRGLHNLDDKFNAVELIWDTGAHGTVVSEDLLSSEFRNYSTHPIHDPYRNETGVKVAMMGKSVFSKYSLAEIAFFSSFLAL